jgi:S1-C subfamily serine protease
MRWYRLAAEQGCSDAQFSIGMYYFSDDSEEAMKWLLCAAKQGHVGAQFLMGISYAAGKGISKDYKEAMKWLLCAAEQGHPLAQYSFGLYCAEGKGVPRDQKEAVRWIRCAAEQGVSDAQFSLAGYYYEGNGVLEDNIEAYAWYVVSAMNGNDEAAKNKDILKSRLGGTQIVAGQARAKELIATIERKKQVEKLPAGQTPAADIALSGYGSGLLVKGGYVVTCWHVVEKAQKISINCQGKDFNASVVQKDAGNDIAILRVDGADAGAALSFSDSVKLGAQVFTMGFPHPGLQGSDVKFTTGSISGLTGPGNTPVYYQISAPLQSGNSGGPLFDEYGNLVGIVAAKLDSLKMLAATGDLTQNVNYAIKSDYLVPLLKTVDGIKIQPSQTKPVNLLSLVEELKKSVVMIKVY